MSLFTATLRNFLVGEKQRFIFRHTDPEQWELPQLDSAHLYIHIPFCKSLCPYCPYNRIRYREELVQPYVDAMKQEIDLYAEKLGKLDVPSLYIGGGTPTNMAKGLQEILAHARERFNLRGDIAIETTVADINDECVSLMKDMGISMISLGVQSLDNRFLKLLGRNYRSSQVGPAIMSLQKAGFESINVDMMFALPGQQDQEIMEDLASLIDMGIEQITTYPLFTFPYSTVGTFNQLNRVKMPGFRTRRRQFRMIVDYMQSRGFEQVSVWGFRKNGIKRYSSVTRDVYIGLGAGAATRLPSSYCFNTFSVEAYQNRLRQNRFPVSIDMAMSDSINKWYWLYWKLYDTSMTREELSQVFGSKRWIQGFVRIGTWLGLCRDIDRKQISLTERGSFWIHLLQNYFILGYINKVWTVMKKEPFPGSIAI